MNMRGGYQGIVGPDGQSILPAGLSDVSAGADSIVLKEHVQKKIDEALNSAEGLGGVKAKFKLEVAFDSTFTTRKPANGLISVWTNGGFNHGGGDEVVYFCHVVITKDGISKTCSNPLELKWIHKTAAICPECKQAIDPKELAGQIFARLDLKQWAWLLSRVWLKLDSNADIRRGFLRGKIRSVHDRIMKKESVSAGDDLEALRQERNNAWAIYPLANILKDTNAGADLEKRIRAFLTG